MSVQQETSFDNPSDFMPNVINEIGYPPGKNIADEASLNVKQKRLRNLLTELKIQNLSPKVEIFGDRTGAIYVKNKDSNEWFQLTHKTQNKRINKLTNLKNSEEAKLLIKNLTAPTTAKTLLEEHDQTILKERVDAILNDITKIMTDAGRDNANLNEVISNSEIIKNPTIARLLLTLGQRVEEYQRLLDEEKDMNRAIDTERANELKIQIDRLGNDVMTLVNLDLAREIDLALNIPLFTRIKHIFRREGLTLIAILGVIGTIISSIFALIFGTKNAASPGPQTGPQSEPQLGPQLGPQPTPIPANSNS